MSSEKKDDLRLTPHALPTGIGSLPHRDPREACRVIWDLFPEIPFWPQLPRRSPRENMYHQYAEGMPGMVIKGDGGFYIDEEKDGFYEELERFYETFLSADLDRFRISKEYAAGLYAWLEGREQMHSAWGIKGQVTGPISFGLQVTQADKRSILYNETLRDVMVKQLLRKTQWQVSILKQIHPRPILFLDEPYLAAFGSAFTSIDRDTALSTFREIFSGIDAPTGIHCCGNTDWSLVLESGLDILSFDAYSYIDSLFLYTEELKSFLSKGGIIAWGIVPTNEPDIRKETAEGLLARLEGAWDRLAALGFSTKDIVARSLITPACGLGSVSTDAATEAFRITRQISDHIRNSFDLNR